MSKAHELGQFGNIVNVSDTDFTTVSISGIVSATSFVGDGVNLANTGAVISAATGTQRLALTNVTSGVMTTASTDAALVFESSTGTLSATNFSGDGSNLSNTGAIVSAGVGTQRVALTDITSGIMISAATDPAFTYDSSSGTLRATSFVGDGSNLSNTGAIVSAGSGTQRVALTDVTSGIMTSAATDPAFTYDSSSGTLSAANFSGDGSNLSNTGATVSAGVGTQRVVLTDITSGVMTSAATDADLTYYEPTNTLSANISGQAGFITEWVLGANTGNTYYTFSGSGFDGTEQNPDIFLTRGQKYKITNNMNAHPFRVQTAAPSIFTPTLYNDGLSDNEVDNGTIEWDVQMDAPSTLYYVCTSHSGMTGVIHIADPANPPIQEKILKSVGFTGYYFDVSSGATTDSFGGEDHAVQIGVYRGGNSYGNQFKIFSDWTNGYGSYTTDFCQVSLTAGNNGSIYVGKGAGRKLAKYSAPAEKNIVLGPQALYNATGSTIEESVYIGWRAGYSRKTTRSVFIGCQADIAASGSGSVGSNLTVIGYQAQASNTTATNEITLGNTSVTALRCQVTSITSLSDRRDKTNIENIPVGLNYINALKPVKFDWARRDGSYEGKKAFGFIAQDLDEVQEQFGYGEYTNLTYHENPDRLEAAPLNSYPILVKAVQELSQQNQDLLKRIEDLENRLNVG